MVQLVVTTSRGLLHWRHYKWFLLLKLGWQRQCNAVAVYAFPAHSVDRCGSLEGAGRRIQCEIVLRSHAVCEELSHEQWPYGWLRRTPWRRRRCRVRSPHVIANA